MPRGEKSVLAMRTARWPFRLCASLASRPMTVVFGLGTRPRMRMRTKLENGVLSKDSSLRVLRMAFVDQGELEAMKTLSGWEAVRCDEHPFRTKMKVST